MPARLRLPLLLAVVGCTMVLYAPSPRAQQGLPAPTYIPQTQFDTGQNIVPVYEGWIRNPDGTFDFVFGYFNRNFTEDLAVPAGPDNVVDPGGPDRGQPTYFLPRRQSRLFRVRVPKDWGQKVLTWSITVNGRTEKAYADLRAVEEINEKIMQSGGNSLPFEPGNENPNKPPSITVAPVAAASVSLPATLIATVTDDGLPQPRAVPQAPPAATGNRPQGQANSGGGQVNSGGAAQLNGAGRGRGQGSQSRLNVRWLQYGGPARVTFNPSGAAPVTNDTARVTVGFTKPGTYKLVATATDGQLSTRADLTVTVR